MAFTLVQSQTGSVGGANAASVTVSSTATGSGHLLLALVTVVGAAVTITPPSGWTQVGTTQGLLSGTGSVAMFYRENCPSGVTSHIFSFSSSCNGAVAFEEWSGVATSGSLDQFVAQQNAKSTDMPTGTTAALAGAGELAVWGIGVQAAAVLTYSGITNSYVQDMSAAAASTQATRAEAFLFYNTNVGAAATSSDATASGGGGTGNTTILAVFKPAVSVVTSTRSLASVSAATKATVGRPIAPVSTALKATIGRPIAPVSTALKATVSHEMTGVMAALMGPLPPLYADAGGTPLEIIQESLAFDRSIDAAAGGSFALVDETGAVALPENQRVLLIDAVTNTTLFRGFVERVAESAINNRSTFRRSVTLKDLRWLAQKRLVQADYPGWTAGNIAADLHRTVLDGEGLTAAYALRRDHATTAFAEGTLSGTTATDNALTLTASGTDYTRTEATTADFNTGTLTNVVGSANALALTSALAIKFSGSVGANFENNNLYCYRKIWAGTAYTLALNDRIYLDVWIDSRSPEILMSIDMQFSDNTWMRQYPTNFQDQQVVKLYPEQDLKGFADDRWYKRISVVPTEVAGKVVVAIFLVMEGQQGGDYTGYFKNIKITNGAGAVQRSIFAGADTTMKANVPGNSNGYYNVSAKVVTVYEHDGVRITPARDISGVGIVKSSMLSWVGTNLSEPAGGNDKYSEQIVVKASIDGGATYQPCTNHAALPNLIVGMNTAGRSVLLRQELAVGGPSPEQTPRLVTCSLSITSAAACTKTDYVDIDNDSTSLGAGTLSNCTAYADGVKSTGKYKDWDDGTVGTTTLYSAGNPFEGVQTGYYFNRSDSNVEIQTRFDWAGMWQHFVAELDIRLVSDTGQYGFEYRTSNWVAGNHRFAYVACIGKASGLKLIRGSNGGGDVWVDIGTNPLTLESDTWYRMKIAVTGSTHQIFLNDVLMLTVTDATYGGSSQYVGVWAWDNAVGRFSGNYDNFGIIGYNASFISTSTRTTPALALGGTVATSCLHWQAEEPSSSDLEVESTLDNGVSWDLCTNDQPVPHLVAGYNAAGKSLKVRFTMTNQAINLPISLQGMSIFVTTAYSASGTRIAPALDCTHAGTVGSSSCTWVQDAPPGTTVAIAGQVNSGSWSTLLSSGDALSGLTGQGPITWDSFDSDTSANYTPAYWSGGSAPVESISTASSRMDVTGGTNALLVWNTAQFPAAQNVTLAAITDQVETGGLVWRYTDVNNCYYLTLHDDEAATSPGTLALRRRAGGVGTLLVAATALPADFAPGTYHVLSVTMEGSVITALFDGLLVFQYTDTTPLSSAGQVGFFQNSASLSRWYSLRAVRLGQDATGVDVATKITLTASSPLVAPRVSDLVVCVRGPEIATGSVIAATDWAYKKTVADALDEAVRQSDLTSRFNEGQALSMRERQGQAAPFVIATANGNLDGSSAPKVTRQSPQYVNRQYVTGAVDLVTLPESKLGNGVHTSWQLGYPIDALLSIQTDGQAQSFGVRDVETGRTFYYTPGENTITMDAAASPPTAQIDITYLARKPYQAMAEDTAQQAILALIEDASGIVEASEDCSGQSKAYADTLAQARIDERARLALDWSFSTHQSGLDPGQYLTVMVPEYSLMDVQFLITNVATQVRQRGDDGSLAYWYTVDATTGPVLGSSSRKLQLALLKKGH